MGRSKKCDTEAKRKPNFSEPEVEQLKTEVHNRRGILFGSLSSTLTFKIKEKEWEKVAEAVNYVGNNNRTGDHVHVKWQNISGPAKKVLAEKKKSLKLTGGGDGSPLLTPDEERMAAILGTERIEGIKGGRDTSEGVRTREVDYSPPVTYQLVSTSVMNPLCLNNSDVENLELVRYTPPPISSSSSPRNPTEPDTNLDEPAAASTTTPQNKRSAENQAGQPKRRRKPYTVEEEAQTTLVKMQEKISQTLDEMKGSMMDHIDEIKNGFFSINQNLTKLVKIQEARLKNEQEHFHNRILSHELD